MKERARELSPKQLKVIDLLLQGKSQSEASREAGIAQETVNRWLNGRTNPYFRAVYNAKKNIIQRDQMSKVASIYSKAMDVVLSTLEDEKSPERVKVALSILSRAVEYPSHAWLDEHPETIAGKWHTTMGVGRFDYLSDDELDTVDVKAVAKTLHDAREENAKAE